MSANRERLRVLAAFATFVALQVWAIAAALTYFIADGLAIELGATLVMAAGAPLCLVAGRNPHFGRVQRSWHLVFALIDPRPDAESRDYHQVTGRSVAGYVGAVFFVIAAVAMGLAILFP